MINKLLPDVEQLKPLTEEVRSAILAQGKDDVLGAVILNMKDNAVMLAKKGIDSWLGYGVYLPAVERVIALHAGESEEDFFYRTQYPVNVVESYSVPGDDLATLVCADQYSRMHKTLVPVNTAVWCLNEEEQHFINLSDYENRLNAVS